MNNPIPINLAVEDVLSEVVLRKMLQQVARKFIVGTSYSRGGNGYIRKLIRGFNNAAKRVPFLVLTDLDRNECAPELKEEWLAQPAHPNLIFRIAVREVEAWILADRENFSKFFGVQLHRVPMNPDVVDDPKRLLVNLVRKCSRREFRRDIVPSMESTSQVGPNYNGRLSSFVASTWDPLAASTNSPSLARTWRAVAEFHPIWETTE